MSGPSILEGKQRTHKSLAVLVRDGRSGQSGLIAVVSLEGLSIKPILNPGGRYVFVDLPEGDYIINVAGCEGFIPARKSVSITVQGDVFVPMVLMPSPACPFSTTDTLVRGSVEANGAPLADALVTVDGTGLSAVTNGDGDFVITFQVTKDLIKKLDGKFKVKVGGDDPSFTATHPRFGVSSAVRTEVREGQTTIVRILYP
jgi:hypothetical protein